jgi:hypothetical protein
MNCVYGPKSLVPCLIRSGSPFLSFTSGRVMLSSMPAIDLCGTISAEGAPAQTSVATQATGERGVSEGTHASVLQLCPENRKRLLEALAIL